MAGFNYLLSARGAWSAETLYQVQAIVPSAAINAGYISCPMVTNAGVSYVAFDTSVQPTLGTAPASDAAWTALGQQAANTPTYAFLRGIALNPVSDGIIELGGATLASSSNISIGLINGTINLPLNKILQIQAILDVTTASTSGATFTIAATNATVVSVQNMSVPASITAGRYIITALVQTTSVANPVIQINASSVTGTVQILNDSTLTINGLN